MVRYVLFFLSQVGKYGQIGPHSHNLPMPVPPLAVSQYPMPLLRPVTSENCPGAFRQHRESTECLNNSDGDNDGCSLSGCILSASNRTQPSRAGSQYSSRPLSFALMPPTTAHTCRNLFIEGGAKAILTQIFDEWMAASAANTDAEQSAGIAAGQGDHREGVRCRCERNRVCVWRLRARAWGRLRLGPRRSSARAAGVTILVCCSDCRAICGSSPPQASIATTK